MANKSKSKSEFSLSQLQASKHNSKISNTAKTPNSKKLSDIVKMVQEHDEKNKTAKANSNGSLPNRTNVEVVVYKNPTKRKQKEMSVSDESGGKNGSDEGYVSMHQARHDIRRFAINNTKGQDRDEAMRKYLVELGAKPPKNDYHNYKDFTKMRIKAKNEEAERIETTRESGEQVKRRRRPERKRSQNDVGLRSAQVGTFRQGVLKLNKRDIKKIMQTKITR